MKASTYESGGHTIQPIIWVFIENVFDVICESKGRPPKGTRPSPISRKHVCCGRMKTHTENRGAFADAPPANGPVKRGGEACSRRAPAGARRGRGWATQGWRSLSVAGRCSERPPCARLLALAKVRPGEVKVI